MEMSSKENKILCFIHLLERWIDHYHKEKKILFVALVNAIFILIMTLVLSTLTYIYVSKFVNSYSTFFLIYLFMLSVIVFQNLFDETFNIITKVKLLILPVISNVNIKRSAFNVLFYLVSWFTLVYVLSSAFDKYMDSNSLKNINPNAVMSYIMLISFIIMFIIQVYGINDLYVRCKRKLLLYGLSTVISLISTIKSIDGMYKNNMGYNDILSFQFIVLLFTLIVSIDRFVSNYSTLITEYCKKNTPEVSCNKCENCKAKNITIESLWMKLITDFRKFLIGIRERFNLFKACSNSKKIKIIICLPISIILTLLLIFISEKLCEILLYALNYISSNIELATYGVGNYFFVLVLYFIKLVLYGLVNYGRCIFFISTIISLNEIKNIIKVSLIEKNMKIDMLKKEFNKLTFANMFLMVSNILPIIFIDSYDYEKSYNIAFQVINSYLGVIIVYVIYRIIIKVKNKSYKIQLNREIFRKEIRALFSNSNFYILNFVIILQSIILKNKQWTSIEIYIMTAIISISFVLYFLFHICEVARNRINAYKANGKKESL